MVAPPEALPADGESPPGAPLERAAYALGRLDLELWSNDLDALRRYVHPRHARAAAPPDAWRATFLRADAAAAPERVWAARDRSYRGERLLAGHYLGHHLGEPALLVTAGRRRHLVVGAEIERVFWSYFLKLALTMRHLPLGVLHLKAAAVDVGGRALLLVGRGGAGKSRLALALCRRHGRLLANTHCLVGAEGVSGIATAVRVRRDGVERLVPAREFAAWSPATLPLAATIVLEPDARPSLRPLDRWLGLSLAHAFAAAIGNYDLKEDVVDHVGSLEEAARLLVRERQLLHARLGAAPFHRAGLDPGDDEHLDRIVSELARRGLCGSTRRRG